MTEPPPKERLPDASHTLGTIQEGGGAEVEPGEGMEGQVHVGDNETGAHQGRADETAGT